MATKEKRIVTAVLLSLTCSHGHQISCQDIYCGECGEQIIKTQDTESLYCGACGSYWGVSDSDKFCPRCGVQFDN